MIVSDYVYIYPNIMCFFLAEAKDQFTLLDFI